jgi:hypothetical protein
MESDLPHVHFFAFALGNNSIGDHSGQNDTAFNLASTFTTGKRPRKNLKMETVRVRRYFPETWLWTDFKFK